MSYRYLGVYIMKYLLPLFLLMSVSACFHSLDASYEGEELIMTERDRTEPDKIYRNSKFVKNPDYKFTRDIYDLSVPLYSIYWNPSTTNYYYVKDGSDLIKTNGLTYKIDPKKEEKIFVYETKDPYLQYAGYISSKERLYIDKRDNQQYIKILIPINDPFEVVPYKTVFKEDGSYSRETFGDLIDKEYSIGGTMYYDAPNQEGFPRSPHTGRMPLYYD